MAGNRSHFEGADSVEQVSQNGLRPLAEIGHSSLETTAAIRRQECQFGGRKDTLPGHRACISLNVGDDLGLSEIAPSPWSGWLCMQSPENRSPGKIP
jgi:hypothetical protein